MWQISTTHRESPEKQLKTWEPELINPLLPPSRTKEDKEHSNKDQLMTFSQKRQS
jgi:hypothetical protein